MEAYFDLSWGLRWYIAMLSQRLVARASVAREVIGSSRGREWMGHCQWPHSTMKPHPALGLERLGKVVDSTLGAEQMHDEVV